MLIIYKVLQELFHNSYELISACPRHPTVAEELRQGVAGGSAVRLQQRQHLQVRWAEEVLEWAGKLEVLVGFPCLVCPVVCVTVFRQLLSRSTSLALFCSSPCPLLPQRWGSTDAEAVKGSVFKAWRWSECRFASLVGAAVSIIFVATKVLLRQTCVCRNKIHLLSQQKYACCVEHIFVMTKLLSWQIFVATNIIVSRRKFCCDKLTLVVTNRCLLWQNMAFCCFCCDRYLLRQAYFCRDRKYFVATNIILLQQKFCHSKHIFVMTIDMFCHDKHMFVLTKMIPVAAPANYRFGHVCIELRAVKGSVFKAWRWWECRFWRVCIETVFKAWRWSEWRFGRVWVETVFKASMWSECRFGRVCVETVFNLV